MRHAAWGRQGAKMVAEFDIKKMMQQQEALYEELLAARGYPAPNKACGVTTLSPLTTY